MPLNKKLFFLLVPVLGAVYFLTAQTGNVYEASQFQVETLSDSSLHKVYEIELKNSTKFSLELPRAASALAVEWLQAPEDEAIVRFHDGYEVEVHSEGSDNSNSRMFSRLIIPNAEFRQLMFDPNKNRGKIKVHVLFVPDIQVADLGAEKQSKSDLYCLQPQWIDQAVWRKGLPDPAKNPSSTLVNHLVVHHSAVASNDTDYVKRVRNIYTFHTQTRGWDDIGYNFLVAPNGQLFAGRDPQGVADQDNMMGAHYCGKNTGTMGVCMMGDYTNETISDTSKEALKHLLVWKLFKIGLSTTDSFRHPKEVGDYLGTVVGHRDGCATACPGNTFYPQMKSLRVEVQEILDQCILASVASSKDRRVKAWPNPVTRFLHIDGLETTNKSVIISSLQGKIIQEYQIDSQNRIDLLDLEPGVYWTQIEGLKSFKFIKKMQ